MRKIDLEAERQFENSKARGEGPRAAQSKFYWATSIPTDRHMALTCEVIANKDVLEIGCASGNDANQYAAYAKNYVGVDISDEAISNCNDLGLTNAEFICVDGHVLPAEAQSVDCVIVNSLLHHLDLDTAFPEISRVLKDDGKLIFREPLGTNPLFQLYRASTPSARTVDERPFTFKDLQLMKSFFDFENVRWFGFSNILSAFTRSAAIRSLLTKTDDVLSKTPMRFLFWQFAGVARKK